MALVALVLAERPLAVLFVAFHAVAVEGRHAVGDELRGLDVSVADRAVGIAGVHVHGLPGGGQLAVVRKGMATCAALHARVEPFLMAVRALGMCRSLHVGDVPHRLVEVAGRAAGGFRLDVGVGMMAVRTGKVVLLGMGRVVPLRGRAAHMVAGRAGRLVVRKGSDVILPEGAVEVDAVARAAGLDIFARLRRFVMAGFTGYLVVFSVPPVVEHDPSPGVFEQEADRRFPNRVMSIAYDRHHGHQTAKNGDKDMTSWHDKHSLS